MATISSDAWRPTSVVTQSRRRLRLRTIALATTAAALTWWLLRPTPNVAETGVSDSVVSRTADATTDAPVVGPEALRRCREALVAAERKLDAFGTMTAVFQKQERIDGELQPLNVMDLKVRREPLSVYMKWHKPDAGQEIIWRDGAHDDKILVCPAGWRRKVLPMVKIDPLSDMALAVSRRPIHNSGIWSFTRRLQSAVDGELTADPAVDVRLTSGDEISGHACSRYTFQNPTSGKPRPFDKAVIFFDQVLGVPVAFELYGESGEGETAVGQLEESYLFRDLQLGASLDDVDFDHRNPAYEFIAK